MFMSQLTISSVMFAEAKAKTWMPWRSTLKSVRRSPNEQQSILSLATGSGILNWAMTRTMTNFVIGRISTTTHSGSTTTTLTPTIPSVVVFVKLFSRVGILFADITWWSTTFSTRKFSKTSLGQALESEHRSKKVPMQRWCPLEN